jgi:hypothetical protein
MIPNEWYQGPWNRVRIWVLEDAARRFDNDLYNVDEDQTDFYDSSGDEGYSDVRERKRRHFLAKALDDVWKSRQQREEKWQEEKKKRAEARKEHLAYQKLDRKVCAKTRLLHLADQLRCKAMLQVKKHQLRHIGRKWMTMSPDERVNYNKSIHQMIQETKKCKMERANERCCESITHRTSATYRQGVQKLGIDLRQWMRRKDIERKERAEERKEVRLRRRVKKWLSMNAKQKKVYSRRQLLVAKQKNKAKIRRSAMKDGGNADMKWTVYWGMDCWRRKAKHRRWMALPEEARKKAWEGRRFEFGFPEGVLITP